MASIKEVAEEVGVSISTVSYALSGKRPVGEDTRRRILQAAHDLGYQPHAGARALAGRRTRLLALTAPLHADTSTPAHMAFVLAVVTAARAYDYDVVLLTEDEAMDGLRRVTSSKLVDGIVLLDISVDDERVDLVRDLPMPAVLVGVPGDPSGLMCVDLDFEAAAQLAVDRLASAGHEHLVLLGEPHGIYERGSNFPRRFRDAFTRAAEEKDLKHTVVESTTSGTELRTQLNEVFAAKDRPTSLVMQCPESIQRSAIDHLADAGLRIPEDVSVISATSSFDTSDFIPPLDVIPLVPSTTTSRAVDRLMDSFTDGISPSVELLAPQYIEHGSLGPRPKRASR